MNLIYLRNDDIGWIDLKIEKIQVKQMTLIMIIFFILDHCRSSILSWAHHQLHTDPVQLLTVLVLIQFFSLFPFSFNYKCHDDHRRRRQLVCWSIGCVNNNWKDLPPTSIHIRTNRWWQIKIDRSCIILHKNNLMTNKQETSLWSINKTEQPE